MEFIKNEIKIIRDQLNRPVLSKLLRIFAFLSRLCNKRNTTPSSTEEFNPRSIILSSLSRIESYSSGLENLDFSQIGKIWARIEVARESQKPIVVFMAPYYGDADLKDGYYRRVKAIDDLYKDIKCLRIYLSTKDADWMSKKLFFKSSNEDQIEIRYCSGNAIHEFLLKQIIENSDLLYHHSIAHLNPVFLEISGVTKVLDVHGAVPEELKLYGLEEEAKLNALHERLAFECMDIVVTVSDNMRQHLISKYPFTKASFLTYPIGADSSGPIELIPKAINTKPVVVYAGGLQKWQMVDLMKSVVEKTCDSYQYKFFVPNPDELTETWPKEITNKIEISTRQPDELPNEYNKAHYGLLLRDDSIINRVSSPTKLTEYLRFGVVPVLNSIHVGDFVDKGMRYITVDELVRLRVPSEHERHEMALSNFHLLKTVQYVSEESKNKLKALVLN